MAYITVNETGTFPAIILSTDIANSNVGATGNGFVANSTGIFSWTDFCSASINKVTTPSDNEISTNIVLDDVGFFGESTAGNTTAQYYGVSGLSQNRVEVAFRVQMNNSSNVGNAAPANTFIYHGVGYISGVAPTASPDAPVWVSPLTIAVNGDMGSGPKV